MIDDLAVVLVLVLFDRPIHRAFVLSQVTSVYRDYIKKSEKTCPDISK